MDIKAVISTDSATQKQTINCDKKPQTAGFSDQLIPNVVFVKKNPTLLTRIMIRKLPIHVKRGGSN